MKIRSIAITVVVASAFAPGIFARGLIATPSQLGLAGKPGETVSGIISVSSSRAEQNDVRVSLLDFRREEDGRVSASRVTHPQSALSWLSVDQPRFQSPAHGGTKLRVVAHIPEQATGSYWALVALDSIPPPSKTSTGSRVALVPRVGIPVVITVVGTDKRKLEVSALAADYSDGHVVIKATLQNTGNAAVLVNGAFAVEHPIHGGDAEELKSVDFGPLTSMPGQKLTIERKFDWSGDAAAVSVHAYLRYGPTAADVVESATPLRSLKSTEPSRGSLP